MAVSSTKKGKKIRKKGKGKEALIPTRLRNPAKEKTKGKKKVAGQTKSKGHSYGPGRGGRVWHSTAPTLQVAANSCNARG